MCKTCKYLEATWTYMRAILIHITYMRAILIHITYMRAILIHITYMRAILIHITYMQAILIHITYMRAILIHITGDNQGICVRECIKFAGYMMPTTAWNDDQLLANVGVYRELVECLGIYTCINSLYEKDHVRKFGFAGSCVFMCVSQCCIAIYVWCSQPSTMRKHAKEFSHWEGFREGDSYIRKKEYDQLFIWTSRKTWDKLAWNSPSLLKSLSFRVRFQRSFKPQRKREREKERKKERERERERRAEFCRWKLIRGQASNVIFEKHKP